MRPATSSMTNPHALLTKTMKLAIQILLLLIKSIHPSQVSALSYQSAKALLAACAFHQPVVTKFADYFTTSPVQCHIRIRHSFCRRE